MPHPWITYVKAYVSDMIVLAHNRMHNDALFDAFYDVSIHTISVDMRVECSILLSVSSTLRAGRMFHVKHR